MQAPVCGAVSAKATSIRVGFFQAIFLWSPPLKISLRTLIKTFRFVSVCWRVGEEESRCSHSQAWRGLIFESVSLYLNIERRTNAIFWHFYIQCSQEWLTNLSTGQRLVHALKRCCCTTIYPETLTHQNGIVSYQLIWHNCWVKKIKRVFKTNRDQDHGIR